MKSLDLKVIDVQRNGVSLNTKPEVRILFYTSAWVYTHCIDIPNIVYFYTDYIICRKTLEILQKEDKTKQMLVQFFKVVKGMSWKTRSEALAFFVQNESFKTERHNLFKSIWLSMIKRKYGKELREDIKRTIRRLISLGVVDKNDKWIKKILSVEKYIIWYKLFKGAWE